MIDWVVYWFLFPACIVIAATVMLTGINGTAMLTPFQILVFPVLAVPVLISAYVVILGVAGSPTERSTEGFSGES